MRFIFFSVNDFKKDGGGVIRMTGVMNELIACGHEVVFITNVQEQNKTRLDSNIRVVNIDYIFSSIEKRIFQTLLGLFPFYIVNFFFRKFFMRMKVISDLHIKQSRIYFFEYLDNSIAYWLFRNGLIDAYINDLHGVVPLEFKFQQKLAKGFKRKFMFFVKWIVSVILDKKVFDNAAGLIFASKAMEDYFCSKYTSVVSKKNVVLPYLLSPETSRKYVNEILKSELIKRYAIEKADIVILFSGVFKATGGVPDLIEAFHKVSEEFKFAKLLLIGDGVTLEECKKRVRKYNLEKKVTFIGRTKYEDLATYQDLADIIVCPDKQNTYSELIIHVKYLDALSSGRIVINGSFRSVLEINKNEGLSLSFVPSDVNSLSDALRRAIDEYDVLSKKYKANKLYVEDHLTYRSNVEVLVG
jgi:glycosyltransferase involved in cell wall biosynthesis